MGGLRVSGRGYVVSGRGIAAGPGSTLVTADLQHQYDAQALSGFSNGDTVSTWPDEQGSVDLSATGAPFYDADGINSNPAVSYDGTDDYHDGNFGSTYSQATHIFMVAKWDTNTSGSDIYGFDGNDSTDRQALWESDTPWDIWSGNTLVGSSSADTNPHIFGCLFNGSSSELRIDGSSDVTGDAGTSSIAGFTLAAKFNDGNYSDMRIGEVLLYNAEKTSSEISDIESYLSDKWGITI